MRAPGPQCGSHEPNAQPWAAMCCKTENSYAWPRPLLDTRAGVDGIAGLKRASIVARSSAKRHRPRPARNARITPGLAGTCWLQAVLGCVAMSSAECSQRLLRCVIGPAVAVGANLQLLLPMWFRQSFFWSKVAAPVWRPAKGPRPGRQRVTPHSISSGACLRICLNTRTMNPSYL